MSSTDTLDLIVSLSRCTSWGANLVLHFDVRRSTIVVNSLNAFSMDFRLDNPRSVSSSPKFSHLSGCLVNDIQKCPIPAWKVVSEFSSFKLLTPPILSSWIWSGVGILFSTVCLPAENCLKAARKCWGLPADEVTTRVLACASIALWTTSSRLRWLTFATESAASFQRGEGSEALPLEPLNLEQKLARTGSSA